MFNRVHNAIVSTVTNTFANDESFDFDEGEVYVLSTSIKEGQAVFVLGLKEVDENGPTDKVLATWRITVQRDS